MPKNTSKMEAEKVARVSPKTMKSTGEKIKPKKPVKIEKDFKK